MGITPTAIVPGVEGLMVCERRSYTRIDLRAGFPDGDLTAVDSSRSGTVLEFICQVAILILASTAQQQADQQLCALS
jgi:hypothetical protein